MIEIAFDKKNKLALDDLDRGEPGEFRPIDCRFSELKNRIYLVISQLAIPLAKSAIDH